jgi:hypothetical protein
MGISSFTYQLASDVVRDGMGLELLDASGEVVAEVFRSDAEHSVQLNRFKAGLDEGAIRDLAIAAIERLGPFENGAPLETAARYDALVEQAGGRSNTSLERTRDR